MNQHFDYTQFNNDLQKDVTRGTPLVSYFNDKCFDIRGIVLGIDLENFVTGQGTIDERLHKTLDNIETTIVERGKALIDAGIRAESQYGVKIRTYRITTSPVPSFVKHFADGATDAEINLRFRIVADKLDSIADELTTYCNQAYANAIEQSPVIRTLYADGGIEKDVYIAGFTSRVDKGACKIERAHIEVLPDILRNTKRIFASVNIADTRYAINSDIVTNIAQKIIEMGNSGAKFSAVTNMPSNTPFFPASYHAAAEHAITLGMAGAGVITSVIHENDRADYGALERRIVESQEIMIKLSERIGKQVADEVEIPYLGLDLSQGSVFSQGVKNSIGAAIEAVNGRKIGSVGTVSDFGLVLGGLQKGAEAATSLLVGYGGEFIPVSEDYIMALRMVEGILSYEGLLAMSGVCAAGVDMLILDRYVPVEGIASMIMDVSTMATWNNKPLGTRLIVPDKDSETNELGFVVLGGLLGEGPEYDPKIKWVDPKIYHKKGGSKPRPPGSARR